MISKQIEGLEVSSGLVNSWISNSPNPNVKKVSQSVWNVTKGFYKNLDDVLKSGLLQGTSAHDVKLQLTRMLNNPDTLDLNELRRAGFEKAGGEAKYRILEKQIINRKVGRGTYKSAKKNAFRLARTEINRAFRQRDTDIRQNLPFVTGIEVKLSNAHPREDICDDMIGIYPKDYNFLGWHPACLCYTVSVLATKEQTAKLIAEKQVKVNYTKNIPKKATNYIKGKKDAINNLKTKPFFLNENPQYFDKLI